MHINFSGELYGVLSLVSIADFELLYSETHFNLWSSYVEIKVNVPN